MICSFTLNFKPIILGRRIKRYSNYASIKRILLSKGITDEELKKIVVTNFITKDKFFEEKNYSLKISSIDSEVTLKILRVFFLIKLEGELLNISGNKFFLLNIHYTNLKWGTYSENNSQAIRDGLNTIPRPDTRKVYELYGNNIYWRELGISYFIESNGWGTDSGFRNYIYRKTPINQGNLKGCNIRLAKQSKPFIIGI